MCTYRRAKEEQEEIQRRWSVVSQYHPCLARAPHLQDVPGPRGGHGALDDPPPARGLHSSTSQLNLSRFWHKIHPRHPLIPLDTHQTPPR